MYAIMYTPESDDMKWRVPPVLLARVWVYTGAHPCGACQPRGAGVRGSRCGLNHITRQMCHQAFRGSSQPWAWLELAAFMLELEAPEAAALVILLVPAAGPLLAGGGNCSCSDRAGAM